MRRRTSAVQRSDSMRRAAGSGRLAEWKGGDLIARPSSLFVCCSVCHRTILLNPRPICPVCRMRLSRNNPSRNRFAERVKDEMHVPCSNSPCPELIKHADLPKHLASCGYRATKCSFRPLGCDWTGAVNQRGKHEKESGPHRTRETERVTSEASLIAALAVLVCRCPVNSMCPRDLLEHVKARNRKHQQQKEDIRCTGALHAHVRAHSITPPVQPLCHRA